MIFRLSQKLNTKIKAGTLPDLPLDENPFVDWSASLFDADRTQYMLWANTKSLYSTVLFGKGITDESELVDRALSSLREFMQADGQEITYRRLIAPAAATVQFAKALNRSSGRRIKRFQVCSGEIGYTWDQLRSDRPNRGQSSWQTKSICVRLLFRENSM